MPPVKTRREACRSGLNQNYAPTRGIPKIIYLPALPLNIVAKDTKYFITMFSILITYALLLLFQPAIVVLDESGCSVFGISHDCHAVNNVIYYSSDMILFIAVNMILLTLRRRDVRRSNRVNNQVKQIAEDMERIIEAQGHMREKRTAYVVQSLKNHMGAMLLSAGIANRIADGKMDNGDKTGLDAAFIEAKDSMQKISDTLGISVDVLDPMLVQQIDTLVKTAEQRLLRGMREGKPVDYSWMKKDIKSITDRLDGYLPYVIK